MKLLATKPIRLGGRRYAEGEEFDMPDKQLADILVRLGKAEVAAEKPKKAKAEEPAEKPKKAYKTRQIKAEDDD